MSTPISKAVEPAVLPAVFGFDAAVSQQLRRAYQSIIHVCKGFGLDATVPVSREQLQFLVGFARTRATDAETVGVLPEYQGDTSLDDLANKLAGTSAGTGSSAKGDPSDNDVVIIDDGKAPASAEGTVTVVFGEVKPLMLWVSKVLRLIQTQEIGTAGRPPATVSQTAPAAATTPTPSPPPSPLRGFLEANELSPQPLAQQRTAPIRDRTMASSAAPSGPSSEPAPMALPDLQVPQQAIGVPAFAPSVTPAAASQENSAVNCEAPQSDVNAQTEQHIVASEAPSHEGVEATSQQADVARPVAASAGVPQHPDGEAGEAAGPEVKAEDPEVKQEKTEVKTEGVEVKKEDDIKKEEPEVKMEVDEKKEGEDEAHSVELTPEEAAVAEAGTLTEAVEEEARRNAQEFSQASQEEGCEKADSDAQRQADAEAVRKAAEESARIKFEEEAWRKAEEESKRKAAEDTTSGPACFQTLSMFADDGKWKCTTCLCKWPEDQIKCGACEEYKPGLSEADIAKLKADEEKKTQDTIAMFTGGSNTGAEPTGFAASTFAAPTSGFVFGVGSSGFTLGGAPAEATAPAASGFTFGGAPAEATAPAASGFTFGGAPAKVAETAASGFTFGGALAKATESAASGFTFGGAPAKEIEPAASGFAFGATAAKPADSGASGFTFAFAPASPTAKGFTFGVPPCKPADTSASGFKPADSPATSAAGFLFGASKGQQDFQEPAPKRLRTETVTDDAQVPNALEPNVLQPAALYRDVGLQAQEKLLAALPDFERVGEVPVGSVYVHGSGECDQLGLGDEQRERQKPTLVKGLANIQVYDIAVGALHVLCLTAKGMIYSWGCNDDGALGRPSSGDSDCEPHPVMMPEGVVASRISCGDNHSCALDSFGRVWLWGTYKDSNGHIGCARKRKQDPWLQKNHEPIVVLESCAEIASGANHTLAWSSHGGKVFAWGSNATGQLGLENGEGCGIAEQVQSCNAVPQGLRARAGGGLESQDGHQLVRIRYAGSEKTATSMTVPEVQNAFAIGATALIFQLPDRDVPKAERRNLLTPHEACVDGLKSPVKGIYASKDTTFVTTTDGLSYACGLNGDGQCGLGYASMAVKLLQGVPGVKNATWMGGTMHSSAALLGDGKVFMWGKAEECGHGLGAADKPVMEPREVQGLPTIRALRCGDYHTVACSVAGDAFLWGCALNHRLGNRPRDVKNPVDKDEEPDDELKPYCLSSKQLATQFVLLAGAGAQHSVELAWGGKYAPLPAGSAIASPAEPAAAPSEDSADVAMATPAFAGSATSIPAELAAFDEQQNVREPALKKPRTEMVTDDVPIAVEQKILRALALYGDVGRLNKEVGRKVQEAEALLLAAREEFAARSSAPGSKTIPETKPVPKATLEEVWSSNLDVDKIVKHMFIGGLMTAGSELARSV